MTGLLSNLPSWATATWGFVKGMLTWASVGMALQAGSACFNNVAVSIRTGILTMQQQRDLKKASRLGTAARTG